MLESPRSSSHLAILGAVALLGLLGSSACTSDPSPPEPTIDRVEPAAITVGDSGLLRIHGSGFHLQLQSDLGSGELVATLPTVKLGDATLDGVTHRTSELLEAEIPASLEVGAYDVVATFDEDRVATLQAGFAVREACATSTCGDGCCSIDEDAQSCPDDCQAVCGDGQCTGGEDTCTCDADCGTSCGDGCCNGTEDDQSCAQDCDLMCGDDCTTCGPGSCCAETCTGDCSPTCDTGCACAFDCADNSDTCNIDCKEGSQCDFDCTNGNNCQLDCRGTASCRVDCSGANHCDQILCRGNAECLLDCSGANNCGFSQCVDGETTCPNGIVVCGRACP